MAKIWFEPSGLSLNSAPGITILEAALQVGIPLQAVCAGRGRCGKCQVKILHGTIQPATPLEKELLSAKALDEDYRLACQQVIDQADTTVEFLPISAYSIRKALGKEPAFALEPVIHRYELNLIPPTLEQPTDDASSLLTALQVTSKASYSRIDFQLLQILPNLLRSAHWDIVISGRDEEVIAIRPCQHSKPPMGIAVDLGTTNIAVYLYNLDNGLLMDAISAINPLVAFGADILSRLSYSQQDPSHGKQLQQILVKSLNLLVYHLAMEKEFQPGDIEEMVVVGNSGMIHLLLNLASRQLINAPYVLATCGPITIKARELGLDTTAGGYVYLPPLVAGFVGSDLVGAVLASRIDIKNGNRIVIDIGTNTEILLSTDGKLFCCSCASGPALEGAAMRFGSVAMPGVVDRVRLNAVKGVIQYHTIQNKPIIGICGSGIIDALAVVSRAEIIDASGRLKLGAPGVREGRNGNHELVLAPVEETNLGVDLTISQKDIRELQLAKGAIRGGIETLLSEHHLQPDHIDEILIAGSLGNYMRVESALEIGLLPPIPRSRIHQIGNAAGLGASLMLLSASERVIAEEIRNRIHYLEISAHPHFKHLFIKFQRFLNIPR